jgi:hypothetical protein
MSAFPSEFWPWLALAGLGLFHGLNPAMGWLFAVALGLQRGSQRIVLLSLVPIAVGHAAAVAAVLLAVVALGLVIEHAMLIRLAAIVLIAWAAWHALYGHRGRVRVGMQTGLLGLVLWSFLMASTHGAGLMLLQARQPRPAPTLPSRSPRSAFIPLQCSQPSQRFPSSSTTGPGSIFCDGDGSTST